MAISFNNIPVNVLTPGQFAEFDNSKALGGVQVGTRRALIIGQRLATGTVAAESPVRIINSADGETYFGRGSQIASMVNAFTDENSTSELWAIGLDDDDASVAAAGSISVGGTASVSGTLNLMIAGTSVAVAVKTGDELPIIASAIVAAVNEDTSLPVTATIDGSETNKVNLTAKNKGDCGNNIDIRHNYYLGQSTPKGLTLTITAMAGGSQNPDVTKALAVFGGTTYHHIVMPYTDASNLTALDTELENEFTNLNAKQISAYFARKGTVSENVTFGNTLNSKHFSILAIPSVPDMPAVWAAKYAGQIVAASEIDPARPYQTLEMDVKAPKAGLEYSITEQQALLKAGMSTFNVNSGTVSIQRAVTTYKTNTTGIEDTSYRDLNTLHTLSYVREAYLNRIGLKFPRYKLADDGTRFGPGQAIVTPKILRAELIALFRELEQRGLVEDIDQYKTDLLVERSSDDPNRVNAIIPPNIVNQFRVFAAKIEFRL